MAWEGMGEDTERSYSACLREISQNASRKKTGQAMISVKFFLLRDEGASNKTLLRGCLHLRIRVRFGVRFRVRFAAVGV